MIKMLRKRKVIKHIGAEQDYSEEKKKADNLLETELGKGVDGITRFNLKEENEDGIIITSLSSLGYFDGNGDFVWKKNKDEEEINQDIFMRDIDKVGLAVLPEKQPEKEEKIFSQNMLFVRLISCLQDGETPMEAIRRLGKTNNKKKPKSQRHRLAFEIGKPFSVDS